MARVAETLIEAVKAGDNSRVWWLCSNGSYSEMAYTAPRSIWKEVKESINSANEDMIGAISSCLVEHMLQVDFSFIFDDIKFEIDNGNHAMADCFVIARKFGESLLPDNASKFDDLKKKALYLVESSVNNR